MEHGDSVAIGTDTFHVQDVREDRERDVLSALEVLVALETSGALPDLSPCFLSSSYGHFLKDCTTVAPHILDGIIARRSAYLANRRRQGSRRNVWEPATYPNPQGDLVTRKGTVSPSGKLGGPNDAEVSYWATDNAEPP
jgi:hypothetical protein